ncbi:hypothetical protein ACHAXH_006404 [Discostella pseudostelligera]
MPSLLSNLKSAREWATPTLKSSAFLSRGVLTPEEFVIAGDEFVYKCPTWSWETCDDPTKLKKYLPPNKQFLMTRNVPCCARVSSMENVVLDVDGVVGGGGGGGSDGDDDDWLVSRILTVEEQRKRDEDALVQEFDILDDEGELMASSSSKVGNGIEDAAVKKMGQLSIAGNCGIAAASPTEGGDGIEEDNDDEYADMADFEDDNVMEDEAAAVASSSSAINNVSSANNFPSASNNNTSSSSNNSNIINVRSYNVSITYDKYYQTPRVWLSGYADDGTNRPLTGQEMMEDVISDYAHRTVTMEYHPHLTGMQHASIHPCQHGAVMKTIIKNLMKDCDNDNTTTNSKSKTKDAKGPSVEMYLFIFLKFVSSMIPTISYDFTVDVSASTSK